MERITVIIPAKNAEQTIEACLRSLASQTRRPDAVILVDDHSTDGTVRLAATWQNRLSLEIRRAPEHPAGDKGAAIARNFGARGVEDGYIFFCDADIVLFPDALEKLARALERHPDVTFAYGPFFFGKKFRAPRFFSWLLRRYNFVSTMSLVRVKDFPGFDESLERFQDWDLWLHIVQAGKGGIRVRNTLFMTDRHIGDISSGTSDILEERFRVGHHLPRNTAFSRILFKIMVRILSLL